MGRPSLNLQDHQARELISRMQALEERHPFNPRDHRPFVRDFLRAVHAATGTVYGAATYRKLLAAYAPGRRPSTATIADEKDLLVEDLRREQAGGAELARASSPQLAELVQLAVGEALAQAPALRRAPESPVASAVGDGAAAAIWKERALELEKSLRQADMRSGQCAAQLAASEETIANLREELRQSQQTLAGQTTQLDRLAATIEDARMLYLRAIDDARGETRAWRERCASIESAARQKAREDQLLLETFRQMAYQRGGAIPPALRKDPL